RREVATVQAALEATALAGMEAEGWGVAGGGVGGAGVDGRVRGQGVDRPAEAGWGRVGVARRVRGPHLEGVAAVSQARIGCWRRAGGEAGAVQVALEGATWLGGVEGEGRTGTAARVHRPAVEEGIRRRQVHRPAEADGIALVAGGVPRFDREHVAPRTERAGIALRAGADGEPTAVQVTEQGRAGLAVAEDKGGARLAGRAYRPRGNRRVGRRRGVRRDGDRDGRHVAVEQAVVGLE